MLHVHVHWGSLVLHRIVYWERLCSLREGSGSSLVRLRISPLALGRESRNDGIMLQKQK
jgi:hypothetical protein